MILQEAPTLRLRIQEIKSDSNNLESGPVKLDYQRNMLPDYYWYLQKEYHENGAWKLGSGISLQLVTLSNGFTYSKLTIPWPVF